MDEQLSYADRVIQEVMRASSAGVDLDLGGSAVQHALEALAEQAKALKAARYDAHQVSAKVRMTCKACGKPSKRKISVLIEECNPAMTARAMAHTAKVVDELARLLAFAKGLPDSRPDLGTDWLKVLTPDQLRQVEEWVRLAGT